MPTPAALDAALNGQADLDDLSRLLIALRRHLHQYPEVGGTEYATARFIRSTLEAHGLTVHGPVAGTGLFTDIEGALPGPTVGYRADIDALPIQEVGKDAYASHQPGVAHLCGHDAHTTVALGVALLLHARHDRLRGTVRVFFQPNEEGTPSGAPLMIQDGVLDGLEAVYAIHVDPALEAGRYGFRAGPLSASADRFEVVVRGPGTGHSARPHLTVDTVWVATQIAQALYGLVSRVTDARNASVIAICRFEAGEAYNVIPDEVRFGGTLRCIRAEDRTLLQRRIQEIAAQTGALHGAEVHAELAVGSPPVNNDPYLIDHIDRTVGGLFGQKAIYYVDRPSMGAEDFAHYQTVIPGAMVRVGTASSPETSYPLHHARFDIDESILAPTTELMATLLENHLARGVLAS